ncbi:MAG: hypothetical protein IPK16_25560 [Anaerolineales bacterium]|nr:hypothetical protein [Anaerolineales bacterium]
MREQIAAIALALETKPLFALWSLLDFEQRTSQVTRSPLILLELEQLWLQFSETRAFEELLFKAGEELFIGQERYPQHYGVGIQTLKNLCGSAAYFPADFAIDIVELAQHLDKIVPVLSRRATMLDPVDQPESGPIMQSSAILAALAAVDYLQVNHVTDGYEIAIHTLWTLCEDQSCKPFVHQWFGAGDSANSSAHSVARRRRLLRDRRLQPHFSAFVSLNYRRSVRAESGARLLTAEFAAWIEKMDFTTIPFWGGEVLEDPLLLRSQVDPMAWDVIGASAHTVIKSARAADRAYVRAFLCNHLESQQKPGFVVQASLTPTSASSAHDVRALDSHLSGAVAKAWLEILACHPDALMQLSRLRQESLLALLVETYGPHQAIAGVLDSVREQCVPPEEVDRGLLERRLPRFSYKGGTNQATHREAWLPMRPYGLTDTYLLVHCDHESEQAVQSLEALLDAAHDLATARVWLKILIPETMAPDRDGVAVANLRWTAERLALGLSQRLYVASGEIKGTFKANDGAFGEMLEYPSGTSVAFDAGRRTERRLIAAADGSYARLIRLGYDLISRAATRYHDTRTEFKITEDDIDEILPILDSKLATDLAMSNFSDDFTLSSSDAFAQLQADREQPWLAHVFVAPANFSAIVAGRSVLVLGSSGAGKTAIRLQLEHLAHGADSEPAGWLLVGRLHFKRMR